MKKVLIVIAIILMSTNVYATTATLNDVNLKQGEMVLLFTLTNGSYTHKAEVRISPSELASCSTWAQLWAVIKPSLDEQATKFQSLDTKYDLLKNKIGVEVTL